MMFNTKSECVFLTGISLVVASPALYFAYKFKMSKVYYTAVQNRLNVHGIKLIDIDPSATPFVTKRTHFFQTTESSYTGVAPASAHGGLGFASESKSVVDKEGVTEYVTDPYYSVGTMVQNPYVHVNWDVTYNSKFNEDNDTYTNISEMYVDDNSEDVYVVEQKLGGKSFIHAIIQHDSPSSHIDEQVRDASRSMNISMATAVLFFSATIKYLI